MTGQARLQRLCSIFGAGSIFAGLIIQSYGHPLLAAVLGGGGTACAIVMRRELMKTMAVGVLVKHYGRGHAARILEQLAAELRRSVS